MQSRGWRSWWQRRSKRRRPRTSACQAAIEPLEDRYLLNGGGAVASHLAVPSPGMQSRTSALSTSAPPSDPDLHGTGADQSARTQTSFKRSNDPARTNSNDVFFLHSNSFQYQAAHDGFISYESPARETFFLVIVRTVTFFIQTESAVTVDVAAVEPAPALALASAGAAVAENAQDGIALSLMSERRMEAPTATTATLAADLITNSLVETALRQAAISGLLRASKNSPDRLQTSHSATLPAAGTMPFLAIGLASGGSALNSPNIRPGLPGSGRGMMQAAWELPQGNSIWPFALDPAFRPQLAGLLGAEMAVDSGALERAVEALVMPMLETGAGQALYWVSVSCWLLAVALACEAARRSWPQQVTYNSILSVSCGLWEERS